MDARTIHTLWMAAVLAVFFAARTAWGAESADIGSELAALKQSVARIEKQSAEQQGASLYLAACATCHGLTGDGNGPSARRFRQHPTNFTKGFYKLRSTRAAVPLPGDIERTIRFGMSGTEMVPFRRVLSERSIRLVAAYVRTLSPQLADADADQQRVTIPTERPAASEQTLARGKALYAEKCAECHGDSGEGVSDEKDKLGFPVVMTDFRRGYFKSGASDQDLLRTLLTGMRGTEMRPYFGEFSDQDNWALVDYIRSLAAPRSWVGWLFRERPSGFDYRD